MKKLWHDSYVGWLVGNTNSGQTQGKNIRIQYGKTQGLTRWFTHKFDSTSSAANDIMISTVHLIVCWLNFGILQRQEPALQYSTCFRCDSPWLTMLTVIFPGAQLNFAARTVHTFRMVPWQWAEHKFQWYSSLLTSCQQVSSKPASGCKRSFNENRSGMVQSHNFAVITPKLLKTQFTV